MLQKVRTIDECIKEIKESDPQTQFTKHALRQLCLTNQIPYCRVGVKILLSLETVYKFLEGNIMPEVSQAGIRRIEAGK